MSKSGSRNQIKLIFLNEHRIFFLFIHQPNVDSNCSFYDLKKYFFHRVQVALIIRIRGLIFCGFTFSWHPSISSAFYKGIFCMKFWRQKITMLKRKQIKVAQRLLHEKCTRKMLMKLTPVVEKLIPTKTCYSRYFPFLMGSLFSEEFKLVFSINLPQKVNTVVTHYSQSWYSRYIVVT